jgi:hypothetical protein
MIYVNILQSYPEYKEDTERPCEYDRKMLPDYVMPEVLFNEMIRCEYQYNQYQDAQAGKQDVHPLFVQKVDGGDCHVASLLAMTFNGAVLAMTFNGAVLAMTFCGISLTIVVGWLAVVVTSMFVNTTM